MQKLLFALVFLSVAAHAVDITVKPTQLRFLIGNQTTSPDQVNNVLRPAGLNTLSGISTYGIEATYEIIPRVNVGVRGEGKWQKVKETGAPVNAQNPFYSSLQQSAALGIARVDLVSTPIVKVDVFGGAGTAATSMDIRTAAGDGNYSHAMGSVITQAGASVGMGWSNIYFLIEVGQEWNKIGDLGKTGVTASGLDTIDLSGTYLAVGLIFNGLPSWIHQK